MTVDVTYIIKGTYRVSKAILHFGPPEDMLERYLSLDEDEDAHVAFTMESGFSSVWSLASIVDPSLRERLQEIIDEHSYANKLRQV